MRFMEAFQLFHIGADFNIWKERPISYTKQLLVEQLCYTSTFVHRCSLK